MKTMSWQAQMTLARLRKGPATTLELQKQLPLIHVARQVWELRQAGYRITTTRLRNRVASYRLEEAA